MKTYLYIIFKVFLILLFSVNNTYSQTSDKTLEKTYKEKSTTKLKDFFVTWSQEIPPITDAELSEYNDAIQQAYKVFITFYKPHRLDSIGGSEWGNDIYKNVDFLIVQNSLKIYFTDKVYYTDQELREYVINKINQSSIVDSIQTRWIEQISNSEKIPDHVLQLYSPYFFQENRINRVLADSIINFRPAIHCDGKIPLFLTEKYENIITDFLGNNFSPLGTGGIMNPARAKKQSEKRKQFLENYIQFFHGHWGGYWQLYSYPQAYSITFDYDMKYAKIDSRMIYQGGEAFLKNENGVWTLISSELTWIE